MDDDRTIIMPSSNSPQGDGLDGSVQVTLVGSSTAILNGILFARSFTIGRSEDNDLSIPDAEVSRTHIEIIKDHSGWMIRDCNSTNGTFIDDKQVTYEPLQIPSVLRLGRSNTLVYLETPGGVAASSATSFKPSSSDDLTQFVSSDANTSIYMMVLMLVNILKSLGKLFVKIIKRKRVNISGY